MSYLRRSVVSLVGLACLTQLAFLTPALAQSAKQLERERLNRVMDPATDVEEFRQEYTNYFSEIEHVMQLFSEIAVVRERLTKNGLNPLETIAQAKLSIANATPDDLRLLRATYAKFPGWRDTPRGLNALIRTQLRQRLEGKLGNKKGGEIVVNAGTTDNCADGIAAGITNTDISIAKTADIATTAIMEGFPTDALTIAARIAPIAAVAVTQAAVLTVETLKGIKDDCNGDTFETAIQNQLTGSTNTIVSNTNSNTTTVLNSLEAAKSTIVDKVDANTATIVNNDNANTLALTNLVNSALTTIINNANANKQELKNLILRTQIEADLASDGAAFVALYGMASTTCTASFATPVTQCGYLDLVRIIVSETIANVGIGTNAQSFLATGDAERAAGHFKAAYASYRKAYKAAAK